MTHRRFSGLVAAATLALLAGCDTPAPSARPDQPPARTTWALRHRVVESKDLQIISSSIDAFQESTGVSLGPGGDDSCFVSVSAPGQGGPELRSGEKVQTRYQGRPAVRDGAGAEGPYLMWRVRGDSWVEVSCADPGSVDVLAAAVRLGRSSVAMPFGVGSLPDGYQVAYIAQDRRAGSTEVYVGRVQPELGLPDTDLMISILGTETLREPAGRAITVNNLPALLDDKPTSPRVCVSVQARDVCVGITPSDTGPYPDRSADVPTLLAIADQLRFAPDLDDRSTWFAAEDLFG